MNTREKILSKIRDGVAPAMELPDMSVVNRWNGDIIIENLEQVIETVGGEIHTLESAEKLDAKLEELFSDKSMIYSNVEGSNIGNVTLEGLNAHDLAKLDVAVLKGEFIVEENGAVFISDANMGRGLIPTITEYLVLVVNKNEIVKNMHEAYKKIDLKKMSYGTFISGPSKTADIESTLVFGAHGAKNLTVILVVNN